MSEIESTFRPASENFVSTQPDRAFVSARAVAAKAGVSRSAVSRTFTPGASVSEQTRKRVLAAAAELGYHVNHLARGLMIGETGIVSLIVSDIGAPQSARLVRALTAGLQAMGKIAMVLGIEGTGDNASAALRQTLNYRADATVVMSGTPSEVLVQTCIDNGQRLILINRDFLPGGPDTIRLDNFGAARFAALTFAKAGCRRLAMVNSELPTLSNRCREQGFQDAVHSLGLTPQIHSVGRFTCYENGQAAGRRMFTTSAPPDAVFCVNDITACGVMDVIRHEFGLRIPDDVSVIGFDDIEQASWLSYGLTTFAQPVDAIVSQVTDLLMAKPGASPMHVELSPRLVWRRSVRSVTRPFA